MGKPNSEDRQYWLLAPVLGLVVIVAVSILIERVSLRPIHADMLFKHGQAYFDQERFDECLDLYRLALEVDPHSDRLWLARGHLEKIRAMRASSPGERRRWFEQAAISIDRAVALHPLFIEHLVYRARLFSAWSDLSPNPQAAGERSERALRDLEQAAARSPGSTGLRNLVAELHLHRGERQQAEALLQRSLTADPRTVGTYLSLARMRLEEAAAVEGAAAEASLRAALELYDRAIVVAPRVPELHAGRGYVMLQLGRPAAAISAYSQALALRPGDTTSHLALANLHHRLGHSLRALKHARVAHESNDQSEKSRAAELIRELVGE